MNYTECIENARPRLGKYCKACPECNGRACKNQMPGPGSKGIGDTAIRNYDKWKQIRVNMDTIAENKPVRHLSHTLWPHFQISNICRPCRCSTASLRRLSG